MAYARIENDTVKVYVALPQGYTFPDGSYTGNFADMPASLHRAEGFLPFEDNPPAYDPKVSTLEQDGYEVTKKRIRQKYKITPIPEEVIAARAVEAEEAAWAAIRSTRNALLTASDWTQLADSTCAEEWREYRQLLRDITDIFSSPTAVIWPEKPEASHDR